MASPQPNPREVARILREAISRLLPAVARQVRHDVLSRHGGGFVTPLLANLLDARQMMAELSMATPMGRLSGEFVQPPMHVLVGLSERRGRLSAVVFKSRHGVTSES